MHKCIMVKIGEKQKTQIKQENVNFAEIGGINFFYIVGKFINFVKIGLICNMHHWLRGDGCPWSYITYHKMRRYFWL